MKRPVFVFALMILAAMFVMPSYASVSVTGIIDDNVYTIYNFQNINSTLYDEIKANSQFNISTIPTTIVNNLANKGLKQVQWGLGPQTNIFNDAERSILISFYLGGPDIISHTINSTTMRRTYQVKTDWRKFQLSLTSTFSINFTQYVAQPVAQWQKTSYTDTQGNKHPSYHLQTSGTGFFDMVSFEFALPANAMNLKVETETITYEVPPYSEDVFLGSPFPVLLILIIVVLVALVYRRAR